MKLKFIPITLFVLLSAAILLSCKKGGSSTESNTETEIPGGDTPESAIACPVQGWASQNGGTTGGGVAVPTVVTSYTALNAAIQNSSVRVIQVEGTITIPSSGRINFQDQSAKTIFGTRGAKLISADQTAAGSGILYVKRCTNILIRNLIFEGPGAYDMDGQDNTTIDNCSNIWVDHCEFRDGMDGNLDIKSSSDYVTVSWTKFTYQKAPRAGGSGGSDDHRFTNLIGSSDDSVDDRGHLRISFIGCWWAEGCVARMPRVRFGKVHVLNSYFNSTAAKSCIQAGFEADLLIESNVFENVRNPIDLMDRRSTAVELKDNLFTNVTGNMIGNGVPAFVPPYTIIGISSSKVKETVTSVTGAGANLAGNMCSSN